MWIYVVTSFTRYSKVGKESKQKSDIVAPMIMQQGIKKKSKGLYLKDVVT